MSAPVIPAVTTAAPPRESVRAATPSLPILFALLVLAWSLIAGNIFLDGDPLWHLTVGRWIAEHHAVPVSEFYSHSMPGIPWTAHEWLSELVMYGTFTLGGWALLHIVMCVCFALTAGYMLRFTLDRLEPIYALALTVVSVGTLYTHFLGRPHVLVWPVIALWVGTLARAGETDTAPPWWLIPILIAWTNLHASFTLALGFGGALALDAAWSRPDWNARLATARRWLPFLLACGAAVLVNPRGPHAILHAIGVMKMKSTLEIVSEWRSADFTTLQIFLLWLMALLALVLSVRVRLSLFRTVFVIGLVYLALKHQRYHSLAGLVAPFILAAPLAQALRGRIAQPGSALSDRLDAAMLRLARPSRPATLAAAWAAGAALIVLLLPLVPHQPDVRVAPAKALAAFQATGAKGKVLNAYGMGGYLIYKGVPVYIDGRGDMYGDAFMTETNDAMSLARPRVLETLLQKYDIGWTLLGPGTPAIDLLDRLPAWQRIYGDSVAVVHVRRDLLQAARVRAIQSLPPGR